MTLDEAIEHAKEKSEDENLCQSCKDEHYQLYCWLLELKQFREKTLIINIEAKPKIMTFMQYPKEIVELVKQKGVHPFDISEDDIDNLIRQIQNDNRRENDNNKNTKI